VSEVQIFIVNYNHGMVTVFGTAKHVQAAEQVSLTKNDNDTTGNIECTCALILDNRRVTCQSNGRPAAD
jgi:hypothetical protein